MKKNTRALAVSVLCRIQETAKPVDQLLEQTLADTALAHAKDRSLIFAMVYGVLRWQRYLDWVLAEFSTHPLATMKNRTLQTLRVGLYQLLFMNRIPDAAAIHETVEVLKSARQPAWLTGFVNGLLRNIARHREEIPSPWLNDGGLDEATALSHPDWLLARWRQRYGEKKTAEICQVNNTEASVVLKTNTRLIAGKTLLNLLKQRRIKALPGRFAPEAVILPDFKGAVTALPGFEEGFFHIQDEAAQLISMLLGPLQPGKHYLDACAGLGGKTSHLAQLLPTAATGPRLIAVEPNGKRLQQLHDNLVRLRIDSLVRIMNCELGQLSPTNNVFAGILLDAPCSGLGVIRRHPDIRWNRTPQDIPRYKQRQLRLLNHAATLLVESGVIVYATCSMEPEENEEVVTTFLAAHTNFTLADCRPFLPPAAKNLVDAAGYFRSLPDAGGMGGFFAARLLRKNGNGAI
jgi:16S rRNA (cytosine967-C5)-methyltransferase